MIPFGIVSRRTPSNDLTISANEAHSRPGISIGGSVRIAMFVAPFLVLLSYAVAPAPMDLVFTLGEILAVILAVSICGNVMNRGQSNWFMVVPLLAVYVILELGSILSLRNDLVEVLMALGVGTASF